MNPYDLKSHFELEPSNRGMIINLLFTTRTAFKEYSILNKCKWYQRSNEIDENSDQTPKQSNNEESKPTKPN